MTSSIGRKYIYKPQSIVEKGVLRKAGVEGGKGGEGSRKKQHRIVDVGSTRAHAAPRPSKWPTVQERAMCTYAETVEIEGSQDGIMTRH